MNKQNVGTWPAVVGVSALMVVCCALLPVLIAGGTIAAGGGFVGNWWLIALGALAILAAVTVPASGRRPRDSPVAGAEVTRNRCGPDLGQPQEPRPAAQPKRR